MHRGIVKALAAAGLMMVAAAPLHAQEQPSAPVQEQAAQPAEAEWVPVDPGSEQPQEQGTEQPAAEAAAQPAAGSAEQRASAAVSQTVSKSSVLEAAEGVFGRGAEGLAELIEDLLRKQGEPNAYITGSEAGGAFIAGVRYGKGMLHHQTEGDTKVYWRGPSVGFDVGAAGSKVFVLVYNLDGSKELFRRYPAAEGHAYAIGGFTASYLRRGDVVLIPIRMGVGVRLGVNAGYMKFSQKSRWFPF